MVPSGGFQFVLGAVSVSFFLERGCSSRSSKTLIVFKKSSFFGCQKIEIYKNLFELQYNLYYCVLLH